jgi:P-type Ca2+ transporter type 2C
MRGTEIRVRNPDGLSQTEAAALLEQVGPNALPEAPPVSVWTRLLRQFASPLIYILLFALGVDIALWAYEGAQGVPVESVAIALILVLNAGLGTYQEGKAEAALARLKAMATPNVWVLRDGALLQVPSSDLVPGDVVRVEAGDRIAADGTLLSDSDISVDESVLTGESLPVGKPTGAELLSGTLLVRGKGYMQVVRTGADSAMGRLATMIGGIEAGTTPLERRLRTFGNQVAYGILALGLALTLGGLVVEGFERIGHVLLFSVALAVAAVPEGLPAVMTLALALGVERLARRKAIVRRLSAVEALGSVTVIATDKTGTLTENRMHVKALDATDEARALKAMVLANDAEPGTDVGDPLEIALLEYAAAQGCDAVGTNNDHARLGSRPFDSADGFMRVTVMEAQQPASYLKGAPEVIIARCRLSQTEKEAWEERASRRAREGYRVLALGWREGEGETDLVFLGLVLLWDPPRAEVHDALRRAQAAGIRVVMITGDHPATAETVGEIIGINPRRVLSGRDIDGMSADELRAAVREVDVFARAAPEHKLKLVEALKAEGEVVAVTGDGVNDAPALKRADVGVAMGQRGSDVAREVADLVLMDDNFATIVAAIEEGRSIYENIQKCIRFLFSANLALVLLVVGGLGLSFLLGLKDPEGGLFLLPLTAVQLLWINVVGNGAPALALTFDHNPGVMLQRPRQADGRLLDAVSVRFIVVSGLAKAFAGIVLFLLLPFLGYAILETRTAVFLYESIAEVAFAYPSRRIRLNPRPNLFLHVAVLASVVLQVLTVLVPALRALLGLVPIDLTVAALVAAGVLWSWAVAELVGRWLANHDGAH